MFLNLTQKIINKYPIGTKFAPPYACIFMDEVEREFLELEEVKPMCWFR